MHDMYSDLSIPLFFASKEEQECTRSRSTEFLFCSVSRCIGWQRRSRQVCAEEDATELMITRSIHESDAAIK